MQSAAANRQPELSDLVLMMEPQALDAFVLAIDRHYLSVGDLVPDSLQEHLLRYAYLAWCKRHALPYVAISRDPDLASILLDLGPVAASPSDLEAYLLDKLASCAAAGSIASDQRRRFVVMMPPDCATALAVNLYSLAAAPGPARRDILSIGAVTGLTS